jgi:hypothetical protein
MRRRGAPSSRQKHPIKSFRLARTCQTAMIMTLSEFGTRESGQNGHLLVSTPAEWTSEADVAQPRAYPSRDGGPAGRKAPALVHRYRWAQAQPLQLRPRQSAGAHESRLLPVIPVSADHQFVLADEGTRFRPEAPPRADWVFRFRDPGRRRCSAFGLRPHRGQAGRFGSEIQADKGVQL